MKEIKILEASGMIGSGFIESSFKKGLSFDPDFIGCDAGSTDGGPNSLGKGECSFSRAGVKRDLRLCLLGAKSKGIPLLMALQELLEEIST